MPSRILKVQVVPSCSHDSANPGTGSRFWPKFDEQVVVQREDLEVGDDDRVPRVEDLEVLVGARLQDHGRPSWAPAVDAAGQDRREGEAEGDQQSRRPWRARANAFVLLLMFASRRSSLGTAINAAHFLPAGVGGSIPRPGCARNPSNAVVAHDGSLPRIRQSAVTTSSTTSVPASASSVAIAPIGTVAWCFP